MRLLHGAAVAQAAGSAAVSTAPGVAAVSGAAMPVADGAAVPGAADLVGEAGDEGAEAAAPYPSLVAAVVAWTIREGSLPAVTSAIDRTGERLQRLSRDDARLTLATAHATKGLEFDDVVVIGMTAGRFPSARSVSDAADPRRALEEERRLAYVAWTRARRSLTLVFEAADPSPPFLEAFDPGELAGAPATVPPRVGARQGPGPRRLAHMDASGPHPRAAAEAPTQGSPARRQPSPARYSNRAMRRMRSSMASRNGIQRSAGSASAIESFGPNAARDERAAARRSRRSPSRSASGNGMR